MNNDNNGWGGVLDGYYAPHTNVEENPGTDFNKIEDVYFNNSVVEKLEEKTVEPITEKVEEVIEKPITENVLFDNIDAGIIEELYNEPNAISGESINDNSDFYADELAEFARLNGLKDIKTSFTDEGKTLVVEGNVMVEPKLEHIDNVVVVEQPTETKVKSVKVNKPKAEKQAKNNKANSSTKKVKAPKKSK